MAKQKLSLNEIIGMAKKVPKWDYNCVRVDGEGGFGTIEMIYSGEINGTDIWVRKSKDLIPEEVICLSLFNGCEDAALYSQSTCRIGAKQDSQASEYQMALFHPWSNYKIGKLYEQLAKNQSITPVVGV